MLVLHGYSAWGVPPLERPVCFPGIPFLLDAATQTRQITCVRTCVIFNPTAKGDKARRFRRHLDDIAREATLKLTTCPGDARRLAAEAVREEHEVVVAAGGDGTLNEVLNGLGDAPNGFARTRLGVLPLGTVNVFARELGLPWNLKLAWDTIRHARERQIDLPYGEFEGNGGRERRYFVQLAGAGLDAKAIELVNWPLKKKIGPLAYVAAGFQALARAKPTIAAEGENDRAEGQLVLIGNGRLYGGDFRIFPDASLNDGLLDVCVFPKVDLVALARCGPNLLLRKALPASAAWRFRTRTLSLTSSPPAPLELDGELVGHLPGQLSVKVNHLRLIVP